VIVAATGLVGLANGRWVPYGRDMPTIPSEHGAGPDYEAEETLVVSEPEQLKALADGVRTAIVSLLRERAYSTHQIAAALGIPKGTAGHHLKVLEHAGLIHVVRTRQVRAITEKFYGRTARLFIFRADDPADARALGATTLRQAAAEIELAPASAGFGLVKARLAPKDARRLERRLEKLLDDLRAADDPTGGPWALAAAFYRRDDVRA
jgi:DNA-binding transcriptional ArsR family regulator